MQSVIFDPLLRTTFECQHRSLSAGWHVHLLRRKSGCFDISSVVWKKCPREGNDAAWKCHMAFHRSTLCNVSPFCQPKINCLAQLKKVRGNETVLLESATWVSTASVQRILLPLFSTKRFFFPQVKLSLLLFLSLGYILKISLIYFWYIFKIFLIYVQNIFDIFSKY